MNDATSSFRFASFSGSIICDVTIGLLLMGYESAGVAGRVLDIIKRVLANFPREAQDALLAITCGTGIGWDRILPHVVHILFEVSDRLSPVPLSSSSSSSSPIRKSEFSGRSSSSSNASIRPQLGNQEEKRAQSTVRAVGTVLSDLFQRRESIRDLIFERLVQRLLSVGTSGQRNDAVLDIFPSIVSASTYYFVSQPRKIRELLEYVPSLGAERGSCLFSSLCPLLPSQPELYDTALLVLRKAMYSRFVSYPVAVVADMDCIVV